MTHKERLSAEVYNLLCEYERPLGLGEMARMLGDHCCCLIHLIAALHLLGQSGYVTRVVNYYANGAVTEGWRLTRANVG